ncbi:MAG: phospholipase, partial [Deltaproteobacteria bacterium]|nr:phospholipase [Deltaproteobacteria bacterium]
FNRGAEVRVILDPNKDAFGRKKNGIPNRQVASELVKLGIPVRWSNTHGEQSHTKMLLAEYLHGQSVAILGSANFTRRNLNNLNLETDIAVYGPANSSLFVNMKEFINLQWNNKDGIKYSIDYSEYEDSFFYRKLIYRWMEGTGMSTF